MLQKLYSIYTTHQIQSYFYAFRMDLYFFVKQKEQIYIIIKLNIIISKNITNFMLSKILNKFVTCTILLYQLNTKNKILIVKYILIFNVLVWINLFGLWCKNTIVTKRKILEFKKFYVLFQEDENPNQTYTIRALTSSINQLVTSTNHKVLLN